MLAARISTRSSVAAATKQGPRRVVVARVNRPTLDSQIQQALKSAEVDCEQKGGNSKECIVGWDVVEELLAAKSHKKAQEQHLLDPLEAYCNEHEDADECRLFDV